jgi:hypothetical protein
MTQTQNIKNLQFAYINWLEEYEWDVAFTLDFRAEVHRERAGSSARAFFHKLDCSIFGSTKVKGGRRIRRACFFEGEANVRNWHIHGVLQLPPAAEAPEKASNLLIPAHFHAHMLSQWESQEFSGRYSKINGIHDKTGWLSYITKEFMSTKDNLDLEITHL